MLNARVAALTSVLARQRLTPEHQESLRFLWNDLEGISAGLRSSLGSELERLQLGTHTDKSLALPEMYHAERWANSLSGAAIGTRVRIADKAIRALWHRHDGKTHATVLWRVYGPRDPGALYDAFGAELGAIVDMTQTAVDLAAKATQRARRAEGEKSVRLAPNTVAMAERELAKKVSEIECKRTAYRERKMSPAALRLVEGRLDSERQAAEAAALRVQETAPRESDASRIAESSRVRVSPREALRERLHAVSGRTPKAKIARLGFIRSVSFEAERMLIAASRAFEREISLLKRGGVR